MTLLLGDSLEVLKSLEAESIDSVVTDPPYGLAFMGKKWDYDVPSTELWREVFRVMKPGAHLLSFGGTRTYHRMVVAVEDAGFEIRDQVQWIYGSGFPKSHNLKGDWEGFGTALKPANEPIVLARKPLSEKTVAKNVERWGTGAINVDAGRIGTEQIESGRSGRSGSPGFCTPKPGGEKKFVEGRWPANVLLDETAAEMLDEQSGVSKSTGGKRGSSENFALSGTTGARENSANAGGLGDSGGASRFFYVAKASKRERNAGLESLPLVESGIKNDSGRGFSESDPHKKILNQNHHPTVKPLKLMEYLIKLVTPQGGRVLDPFMGSGSTGVAAKRLGFDFVGIEMNEEYLEIAKKRCS